MSPQLPLQITGANHYERDGCEVRGPARVSLHDLLKPLHRLCSPQQGGAEGCGGSLERGREVGEGSGEVGCLASVAQSGHNPSTRVCNRSRDKGTSVERWLSRDGHRGSKSPTLRGRWGGLVACAHE